MKENWKGGVERKWQNRIKAIESGRNENYKENLG